MSSQARSLLMLSLTLAALASTVALLASCPDNDNSITDCSRRQQPQHYDGTKWTCKK